jgi:hypothetical protein
VQIKELREGRGIRLVVCWDWGLISSFLDLYIQFIKLGMFTTPGFENYYRVWNVLFRGIWPSLGA